MAIDQASWMAATTSVAVRLAGFIAWLDSAKSWRRPSRAVTGVRLVVHEDLAT